MKKISVNDILRATGGQLVNAPADCDKPVITGVNIDSRQVTKDGLFVAIKGERVDGHNFMAQVFENKAAAVLCDHVPEGITGTCIVVDNTVKALQQLAAWYRQLLGIKVVGITGSVGKTSTKEIVASVLAAHFRVHKTKMNFNNEIGLPLTVLSIEPNCEIAVLEMGISDFGEMLVLSSIARPDICVITNIGQAHLEFLGSRDGILKAKSEIFEYMNPTGSIYLYGDDDKLQTLKQVKGITPTFFGFEATNNAYPSSEESLGLLGTKMHLVLRGTELDAAIYIPGKHMLLNAVAAAQIGYDLGMTEEEIVKGLAEAKTVSGRCNMIPYKNGYIIDDCYNASPASMRSAIDTLCLGKGHKVAILGDMFEMGEDSDKLHYEVGCYAGKADINKLICVGEAAKHIHEGAKSVSDTLDAVYFATLEELFDDLTNQVREDDIILVKSSNGMHFSALVEKLKDR